MAGHTDGIRWQIWAALAGGLCGLVALAYFITRPNQQPAKTTQKRAAKARSGDHNGWSTGSFSTGGTRRRGGKVAAGDPNDKPPKDWRADARDGGHPERSPHAEKPPERQKPKLKKPGWLRGKVMALPGRQPIQTFTVRFAKTKRSFWMGRAKPKTDPTQFPEDAEIQTKSFTHKKGHFDIYLEAGTYLVQIKAKGFRVGTPAPGRSLTGGWFRQTFAMLRDGRSRLMGRVMGKGGKPLHNALAITLITGGSRWGWRMLSFGRAAPSSSRMASTDTDGNFTIGKLPAGKYGIMVRAKGYTSWQKRGITLSDGEHKNLGKIQLDGSTGSIKGTVFGPDGKPKSGAFVVAMGMNKGRRSVRFMRTDAGGKYVLDDVKAGKVRLFARLGRGMLAARKMHHLTLKVGQTATHDFYFGQGGLRLFGKVLNADGSPVAEATVNARSIQGKGFGAQMSSGSATTDKDGNYSISGLKKGIHTINISIDKKPSNGGEINVEQAETQHDIRLQGGGITVSFVDQKTQRPPKVPVWAILTWKSNKTHRLTVRANPGKTATFQHLPEQGMSLRIFSPGYAAKVMSNLRPGTAANPKAVKMTLTPAGKYLLTLQVPKGKSLTRVYTQININGKYQWLFTQPTPGGDYEIRGLSPGPAQIKINATGFKPLEVNIDVPTKTKGHGTFALTPAATPSKSAQ